MEWKPPDSMDDLGVRSHLLPGGNLISAVLNREVMALADRGGASNLVGDRWAALCALQAANWAGQVRPVPGSDDGLQIAQVLRLDDTPAVAATASRRGLQNPDLLFIGMRNEVPTIQAADAKFSVETARSKQVSPAVVEGLLGLRDLLPNLLGHITADPALVPGVFLCPDYPLTHHMLHRRQGILRTTVRTDEVVFVPAPPKLFFEPLQGSRVMVTLAAADDLPVQIDHSLLAALYYFRLARAAIGCWLDGAKPLLLHDDRLVADEAAVRAEAETRRAQASSACDLVLTWNDDVQAVRAQRAAVDQVATLPLLNRELRARVVSLAETSGVEPPSLNQVRRRLSAWYRGQLRDQIGPLPPPVADFPRRLEEIGRLGAALAPQFERETERVVAELVAARLPTEKPALGRSPVVSLASDE